MQVSIVLTDYLTNDDKTDNTESFNQLLTDTKDYDSTVISVPAGVYRFNTIYMHSNITFNFDAGAVFKSAGNWGVIHYPSHDTGYEGGVQNVTWNNANFVGYHDDLCNGAEDAMVHSLLHAKNIIFNRCTFTSCQHVGGHCIDLGGCSNILVWQCKFIGYGNSLTDHGGNGNINSEAVQCDYAYAGGMSYKYDADADSYDDLPTHHVYVLGCDFEPFYVGDTIKEYAPCPVGQHISKNQLDMIHDIYIIGNKVIDAYPQTTAKYYFATIHFPAEVQCIVVVGNTFERDKAPASLYVVALYGSQDDTLSGDTLIVVGNQYINCDPQSGYTGVTAISEFDQVLISGNTDNALAKSGTVSNVVTDSNNDGVILPNDWPATLLPVFFNANYLWFLVRFAELSNNSALQLFGVDTTYTPNSSLFSDVMLDLNRQGYLAEYATYTAIQHQLVQLDGQLSQVGIDTGGATLWTPEGLTLNIVGLNANSKVINGFFKNIKGGL